MSLLTLLITCFLAGSLVKLTDDIEDKNLPINRLFALPLGIAYGLLMGYLMLVNTDASLLFGGIVIGCLITGKINSIGHYFGLSAILAVVFLYGIKLSPLVFPIAALAALDEMKSIFRLSRLNIVFDYRLVLKLGILLLVIVNMLGLNALLILIAFDSAYIITGRINSRFS
ncbi:MAG: hypothetical protein PHU34_02610 [Candidatus Methanoperedens sp.]|nr:hypothetical protein [Candidatus Methanoperedens sp.]